MKKTAILLVTAILGFAMIVSAQDVDIVKVQGEGTGANKMEALKDAYRDAIERAVGMYVDAEQMMKNEQLVKDQILTHSNAYIEKYNVVKENTRSNGLVELHILAEVRKTALTTKINDVMPSKTVALGAGLQNAHARIATAEKRNADGAALLANAIEGFDPFVASMDCSLASRDVAIREKRNPREQKNTVAANWLFKAEINQMRFFENTVPRLQGVLEQVSLSAPRRVKLSMNPGSTFNVSEMVSKGQSRAKGDGALQHNICSALAREPSIMVEQVNEDAAAIFLLVTAGNAYRTTYDGIIYELDSASASVLSDWLRKLNVSPDFAVSLLDAGGDVVFNGKIRPMGSRRERGGVDLSSPPRRSRGRNTRTNKFKWIVLAPWLGANGKSIELERYSWHEFVLPENVLPDVKNLKIEVVQ